MSESQSELPRPDAPPVAPPGPQTGWTDERIDAIMGLLLRTGVVLSAIVVAIGGILFLAADGRQMTAIGRFHGEPSFLLNPIGIVYEAVSWRYWTGRDYDPGRQGRALIQVGVLLLIATPVARVAFSVFAFAVQRDWFYVLATLLVLTILLYGLFAASI